MRTGPTNGVRFHETAGQTEIKSESLMEKTTSHSLLEENSLFGSFFHGNTPLELLSCLCLSNVFQNLVLSVGVPKIL